MFKKHHNILFEQMFFVTFSPESPLSLLFAGCQYRSNLHCSRRSEPWCSNWQRKACLVRLPWHSNWCSAYQLHCTGIQSQWKHSCLRLSCFWFVICNFHPITHNFGSESMIKKLDFFSIDGKTSDQTRWNFLIKDSVNNVKVIFNDWNKVLKNREPSPTTW